MAPVLTRQIHEVRFRAMGSEAHVMVLGPDPTTLDRSIERLAQLEARWSRFLDDSEISRLNRTSGPVVVSPDTYRLVHLAVVGWERSAGLFDPTVHDAVIAAGYDRWANGTGPSDTESTATGPLPGCSGILCNAHNRTVHLPPGVRFDPGGIGKGLAADMISAELMAQGARGCLVNVGGDLRVRGAAPDRAGWLITVAEPSVADNPICRLALRDGAVATSTTEKRAWSRADGSAAHHLIDPFTGRPHDGSVRLATVVTRDAWWAEVLTKRVMYGTDDGGGMEAELDNQLVDAAGLVVTDDGTIHRSIGFGEFEQ